MTNKTITTAIFSLGALASVVVAFLAPTNNRSKTMEAPKAAFGPEKSPEMQEKRLAFIKELVSRGVFSEVENINKSGHLMPNVWVGSTFYGLEFDEKKAFLGAVFAYYFDGTEATDTVYLMDHRSGKEVGRFNSGTLEMY